MPVVRPALRRSSSLAVAVVAVLALSACSDADEPGADPAPGPTAGSSAGETVDASPSGPSGPSGPSDPSGQVQPAEVDLLDAGEALRRAVEFDVEEGHTETTTLELTTTTEVDFMSSPAFTVPMTIPFTTTVADVTDDEITVDVTYGAATVTGGGLQKALLEQARTALGHLEGLTTRVVLDPSGAVRSREVEVGEDAPDLVGRILEDVVAQGFALTVPFPAEEIGVGARWRVASAISIGGTGATVESTYELTELTDDGYTVAVRSTQTAVPGDTVAGKVVDGSSTATGSVRGRVDLLSPVEATSSGEGDTTVEIGGQRVTTTFEIRLRATTR